MQIPFLDASSLVALLSYTAPVDHQRQAHCKAPPEVQRELIQESLPGGAHAGDLTQPIASGVIGIEDVLHDLFELCRCRASRWATCVRHCAI